MENLERTLIFIENFNGEKHIHYSGYSYFSEEAEPKPYRWVDYTWFVRPLVETLTCGIKEYVIEHGANYKQYISDMSLKELEEKIERENCPVIEVDEITLDIPYGVYWIIDGKEE